MPLFSIPVFHVIYRNFLTIYQKFIRISTCLSKINTSQTDELSCQIHPFIALDYNLKEKRAPSAKTKSSFTLTFGNAHFNAIKTFFNLIWFHLLNVRGFIKEN
jgi:hypothetical protein